VLARKLECRSPSADADALELAEAGLVRLGWSKREAKHRAEAAWRSCSARATASQPIEAAALVLEAVRTADQT
jgi:hypothetical protein